MQKLWVKSDYFIREITFSNRNIETIGNKYTDMYLYNVNEYITNEKKIQYILREYWT